MNESGVNRALEAFAEGFFEVLDPLLSLAISHRLDSAEPWKPEGLDDLQSRYPIVMEGTAKGGGAVAVLLTLKDALRMAGLVFGNSDKATDRLAEHDLATLRELGTHAVGGGLERLGVLRGSTAVLEDLQVFLGGPRSVQRLRALPSPGTRRVAVQFSAPPELDGEALLLVTDDLLGVEAEEPEPAPHPEPLSPREEARAVFPEFSSDKEPFMAQADGSAKGASGAGNLDMILDIRLVVRARLGRVELPIGEILGLGPGSIIEVGRTLDEPVELLVNDKLIARGDVVVVDEKFGLRITEIVSQRERIESLI